jgi:ATP-dependent Clp protease adaptor protein ClpS
MSAIRRVLEGMIDWLRPVRVDASSEGEFLVAGEFPEGGPLFGMEITNDDSTPMEFVVDVLQKELNMSKQAAVRAMLHIHRRGSILFVMDTLELAESIAATITARARDRSHPLICRAVTARQSI